MIGTLRINDIEKAPPLSQRVAKNSFAVLGGQVFSLAANLGATALLARHLGQVDFGLFSYAIVYVSLFALVADFGMQTIIVRELNRREWSSVELLGNAVLIKAALSLAAIILAILVARLTGYSETLFIVIAVLSLNIPITAKLLAFRNAFEAPFHASLQMQLPMLFQMLDSFLLIGVTFGLIHLDASLEWLVLGYVLSNLPGLVLFVFVALRRFQFQFVINKRIVRFLFKESLPLWLYTILTTLFGGADVLLLKELSGEGAVGLYSAATRLASPLMFIPNAVVVSLFPLLSRYYEQSDKKLAMAFHFGMKVILLVALALAIATTFYGPAVVHLLYSDTYKASTAPLIILMWSQAFLFLNFFFASVLTSANQQRTTFHAAATMLLANIVANLILIPALGIRGTAWAKLFSSICGFAVLFRATGKVFVIELPQLLPRLAALGVAFACGVALLSRAQFGTSLIVAIWILPLFVLLFRVFNKEERAIFRSLIPKSLFRN